MENDNYICRTKVPLSKKEARTKANRKFRLHGIPVRAYHCAWCNHWHIGKVRNGIQVRRRVEYTQEKWH